MLETTNAHETETERKKDKRGCGRRIVVTSPRAMNPFRPYPFAISGHTAHFPSFFLVATSGSWWIPMSPRSGDDRVGRGSKVAAGKPFSRIYYPCVSDDSPSLPLVYLLPGPSGCCYKRCCPSGSSVSRLLSERNVLLMCEVMVLALIIRVNLYLSHDKQHVRTAADYFPILPSREGILNSLKYLDLSQREVKILWVFFIKKKL